MNKSIYTLIPDIYRVAGTNWLTYELAEQLAKDIAKRLTKQERRNGLRLSKMGPRCPKALWHSVHTPELAAPMPGYVHIKLLYGHILEALVLTLARAAGHTVQGEQDELEVAGVLGHRDAVIDGRLVDVKSSSVRALDKIKLGTIEQDDGFGYLDQLDAYLSGSATCPLTTVKDKGYLLGIGKELGHLELHEHQHRDSHIRERIRDYKQIIARSSPPDCLCGTKSFQGSGNIQLDVRSSYDDMRYVCWPHLRTFLYSKGPIYLTKVVREPKDGIEVDKNGRRVYNGLHSKVADVSERLQVHEPVAGMSEPTSRTTSSEAGRLLCGVA